MRYEITFSPDAVRDLGRLKARDRATIRDMIGKHLRHEPEKVSRSRIKRLQGFRRPQYRLRVEDFRVFYDVQAETVEILTILPKATAYEWLEEEGEPEAPGEGP